MFSFMKSKSSNGDLTAASPMKSPKPKLMHRLLGSPGCLVPPPPTDRTGPANADATPKKTSPKRPRDEDEVCVSSEEVIVSVADPAAPPSPVKKASRLSKTHQRLSNSPKRLSNSPRRLSNSPRRQLRARSVHSPAPSEITPPGISAVMKEVRRDRIKKKRVWDKYFSSSSVRQPCPACGQTMTTAEYNFEIQQMIPRGFGADDAADDWNLFLLCSNVPDGEDEGGWGCSELLEREQCVAVEELEEETQDEESASPNALDWLVANYPNRVHEILIRLQRAHGESFGMPAGESLCLRFARDLYQFGCSQGRDPSNPRNGEWERLGIGFRCDIVDIADCLRENTDSEVLRRVELKDLLTPKKGHMGRSGRTPLSIRATGPPVSLSGAQPKNLSVSFNHSSSAIENSPKRISDKPIHINEEENDCNTTSRTVEVETSDFY